MKKIFIILGSIVIVALIGGGIFFYVQSNNEVANNIDNNQPTTQNNQNDIDSTPRTVGVIYNGEVEEGEVLAGASDSSGYLFVASSDQDDSVFYVSRQNYELWVAGNKAPSDLVESLAIYKLDILSTKLLEDGDNTITTYELIDISQMSLFETLTEE